MSLIDEIGDLHEHQQLGLVPTLAEEHAPAAVNLVLPLPERIARVRGASPKKHRAALNDEMLYDFIAESQSEVSSDEVSEAFGVSKRVVQKHLAALHADRARNVLRSAASAPYIYFVETPS